MTNTRNIRKNLIGMEDIAQGVGLTTQKRGTAQYGLGRVDVPYAVSTIEAMQLLDVDLFTRARVYSSATVSSDYIFDAAAEEGDYTSTNSAGYWIKVLTDAAVTSVLINGAETTLDVALNTMFTTQSYQSIADAKAKIALIGVGNTIRTPRTLWTVTDSATYTLAQRADRTFNALDIGDGKYLVPAEADIYAEDFLDDAVTASNDEAVGEIAAVLRDGSRLDFGGKMFRMYAGNNGIASASAVPATSVAQDLDKMLTLRDLRDVTLSSGGLYAADQGTSGTKKYFPSTLYVTNCVGVAFEPGSTFEAKGESWGDSDASIVLDHDVRADFLGQNGGHAIVVCRSRKIRGTPTARLAGSTGPLYFSSSDDVALDNPFSNSASLGYASFSFDAWCGNLAVTGFEQFAATINNPVAHKETLTRREDGVVVGSSSYCGKGGVVTEDPDISVTTFGGFLADMFANGGSKDLGYAFGAGSGSVINAHGPVIRNCQSVIWLNWSVIQDVECNAFNIDAETGLTGIFVRERSFGSGRATLTGKLRIDGSRIWPGEDEPLATTSVVASLKPVSAVDVTLDLDAAGAGDGTIYSIITNSRATYGGITITGGKYVVEGYIIRSPGWGGSSANQQRGLIIKGGAYITITGDQTDSVMQYTNYDGTTYTYVYQDLRDCTITCSTFRSVDWPVTNSATLREALVLPNQLLGCYSNSVTNFQHTAAKAEFVSAEGLSGSNSLMTFMFEENKPMRNTNSYIVSNTSLVRVSGLVSSSVATGELVGTYLLAGDVRTQFTAGSDYPVLVFSGAD